MAKGQQPKGYDYHALKVHRTAAGLTYYLRSCKDCGSYVESWQMHELVCAAKAQTTLVDLGRSPRPNERVLVVVIHDAPNFTPERLKHRQLGQSGRLHTPMEDVWLVKVDEEEELTAFWPYELRSMG